MHPTRFALKPLAAAAFTLAGFTSATHAQTPPATVAPPAPAASAPAPDAAVLPTVTIRASADASAEGLSPAYPGGQVARGGRAGILGTKDHLDTPFSITAYTNELIQDRQAKSVGDVLQNDPGVRTARGFGNFQEAYFIRGFILGSDDVAYNGLYSLLPRQYIATELFERVEVLRGASAFLTGANPGGGGIGGAINLLPKRAPNENLTRVTAGFGSGSQRTVSADLARRFGPDQATGVRVNLARRDGGTAVDDEDAELSLASVGVDWRSATVRLSGDIGWQNNKLRQTRPNVTLSGVGEVPDAPDGSKNFAQPWSYSNEKDLFGTLRAEVDLSRSVTAWAAYGFRRSDEANSLANLTVTDAATGAGNTSRFDNTREDEVDTGEIGLRGKLTTGSVKHEWVISASSFRLKKKNAYEWDFFNTLATGLYDPISYDQPAFSGGGFRGNELDSPALTGRTKLTSVAVGDTLAFLDDTVLLTVGARHQKLHIQDYAYDTGALTNDYDKSRTSPTVGLVVKASDQLSVYANYIEGLTQGESASGTPPPVNLGESLEPYVSKQKEVGLKYDAGRWSGNVALFSTTQPRSLITSDLVFTSEGENRHRGVELTVFGEARRGLRVLGGATWLDAKQRSTGDALTEDRRVIGVPRFQANLGAEWDVPMVRGLAIDSRVVHTGSSYADAAATLEVPGWTRLDAGVRLLLDVSGKPVTFRARVDNLTDRDYWASSGGFPNSGYLVVGGPRSVSLSASVDF